ncbi:hypothetical protein OHA21_47090 [Actinoplanes sp. NBC_00393]|uniref:DUF6197 family protein n=1 Tax=Actinoplanes sp. NBC_00393 TaxID=2975953 RepID=UPI002E1C688D
MHRTQNPTSSAADTTTEITVTPADTLRGAAHYLELRGWTRNDYYAGLGAFPAACALGAIGMAAHGRRTDFPTSERLETLGDCRRAAGWLINYLSDAGTSVSYDCGPTCFDGFNRIVDWNDNGNQTAKNVIATLRAAADEFEWAHASPDDLETYADSCAWAETWPTREGFLAWLAARR